MCGQVHWQAAKTKAKSLQKLDETGVMVAGCRHALMQKAVNMWTGEMYGYGFYLQVGVLNWEKEFLQKMYMIKLRSLSLIVTQSVLPTFDFFFVIYIFMMSACTVHVILQYVLLSKYALCNAYFHLY